ncbi:MAG: PD-(D/E)XK nuclease family protein, partial [Acetatifactor sp.]|nr:PD-(D/E)XK nuclease family protein [Acetatifactor sp.]
DVYKLQVMSGQELGVVSAYVSHKVRQIGREILEGHMELNPYEKGSDQACTYCAYKKVCGFDPGIPGYHKRLLKDLDKQEALSGMEEELR